MADRSGQQLESYRLLKRLGGGAFGDVYLAEDHRKRKVAIKILHGDFNAQQLQVFLREARIIRLRHEHIVSVLDFGVEPTNSTPYIVMDYATEGTLLSRHPRGSRLPLSTVIPYVTQIAAALHEAHEEGIIHRDVKPENILLDHNGSIKLADFGIAVISQSARTSLEGPQGKAGTPWYMAPEQIQGKPSRASDQYALATIVYEWLTGEPPFIGGIWEVYGQHLHAPPDPLPNDIEYLTPELEAVLMKALAKNSKDRYPTIQDFADALQAAYEQATRKQAAPSKSRTEWVNEGIAHRKAGRYDEAIAVWNQLLQQNPSDADAYYNRGFAYYAQQKYAEAIADFGQAIKLNPSHAVAYANRAATYIDMKEHQKALADADQAIRLNATYALAYQKRGLAYNGLRMYEQALIAYTQAIKLNPSYADFYVNRGLVYYSQQKYAEAIADYGQAIKLNPSFVFAYNGRGMVYEAQQKYSEAIADYGQAIKLNPSHADAYNYRGLTYYNQQKYSEAIADYGQAIKLKPSDADAYNNRGNAYYDQQKYSEAIADYGQVIKLKPSDTNAYYNRGYSYYMQQKYAEAIADYDRVLALNPQDENAQKFKEFALRKLQGR